MQREVKLLVVLGGGHRVGLPIRYVRETMRPRPLMPFRDAPPHVLGMSVIRGASVPVVALGALIGEATVSNNFLRFVTLEVEGRAVALAVESVVDVISIRAEELSSLSPLLARAAGGVVEALSVLDAELLLVLQAARVLEASGPFALEGPTP